MTCKTQRLLVELYCSCGDSSTRSSSRGRIDHDRRLPLFCQRRSVAHPTFRHQKTAHRYYHLARLRLRWLQRTKPRLTLYQDLFFGISFYSYLLKNHNHLLPRPLTCLAVSHFDTSTTLKFHSRIRYWSDSQLNRISVMKTAYLFSLVLAVVLVSCRPPGDLQQGRLLLDCPTDIVIVSHVLRVNFEIAI